MKTKILNIENDNCSRREFLKDVVKSVGVVTVGSFVISQFNACSDESNPTSPSGGNNQNGPITIDISLSENSALANVGGSIVISGNNLDGKGMLIIRSSETTVSALSRNCTHQGCTLPNFQGGASRCPCHGSRFDTAGKVLNGPATDPLKTYSASIDGNIITVTG